MGEKLKPWVGRMRLINITGQLSDNTPKLCSSSGIIRSMAGNQDPTVLKKSQIRSSCLNLAKQKATDGVSFIKIASNGLNTVEIILVKMREKASSAHFDGLSRGKALKIDNDFRSLNAEAIKIIDTTEFNGCLLLKSHGGNPMQIFIDDSNLKSNPDNNELDIAISYDLDTLKIDPKTLANFEKSMQPILDGQMILVNDSTNIDMDTQNLTYIFNQLDAALNGIVSYRLVLNSLEQSLNNSLTLIDISLENLKATIHHIDYIDTATEIAKFT